MSARCATVDALVAESHTQRLGWPIRLICRAVGVNRAWYYARKAPHAAREAHALQLKEQIETLVRRFPGYGYRRVTHALHRNGQDMNHKRVLRLMQRWQLTWHPFRAKRTTTVSDPTAPRAENVFAHNKTTITGPNQAWVGDVMYLATRTEHGYLATLLDAYSRCCVGWAVSRTNDTALTLAALNRAVATRAPAPGLIHHTDHGSNYTSHRYGQRMQELGMRVSHSCPGRPQENGIAESFNKTIQYEKILLEEYATLAEAEIAIGAWIDPLYNTERLHSSIDYRPPYEFEQLCSASPSVSP